MPSEGQAKSEGELCSYALEVAGETAEAGAKEARSRPWTGLTSHEVIFISVERLLKGDDVDYLISHESVHLVLLRSSAMGMAQLVLEVLSHPLRPSGLVPVRSRQCLKILVEASRALHEICATVWPQAQGDAKRREKYWADQPASYRESAWPIAAWLDRTGLPGAEQQKLVAAMGEFALGCEPPPGALVDPGMLRAFLDDAAHHPERRFELARGELEKMSGEELAALARADSPPAALAAALTARLGPPAVPYTATPVTFGEWYGRWQSVFWDVVSIWLADPRLGDDDRSALPASREQAIMSLQPPDVPVMQAMLTQTFAVTARAIPSPRADDLLGYPLCLLSWNGLGRPIPGFERVGDTAGTLERDQAALWLYGPGTPLACAVAGQEVLTEYVNRLPDRSTLCVDDAFYLFPDADVLAAAPIVRDRRHLVIVRHRPLGSLINDPLLSMGLAHERRLEYTTWQGSVPGVSYFLFRPAERRTPVVVAPVPAPTAERALRILGGGAAAPTGLEWVHVPPDQFVNPLDPAAFDLVRFGAWFEDQPWPEFVSAGSPLPAPLSAPKSQEGTDEMSDADEIMRRLGAPPRSKDMGGDALRFLDPRVRTRLDEVRALEAAGRLDAAAAGYGLMILEKDPQTQAAGAIALGMLGLRGGDFDGAIAAFTVAGESGDRDLGPLGMLFLGQALQQTGNVFDAGRAFSAAAASRHPQHAPPAAFCLAGLLATAPSTVEVAIALLRWVVESGHPDVAALAADELKALAR